MKKDLSLLIISHNRPELLRNCLRSIEKACDDFKDRVEVIVGFNGSSSDDPELRNQFQNFTNLNFVTIPAPLLPGSARNELLKRCSGDWVYFLDDDIEVHENHLRAFFQIRGTYPELSVIGGPNLHLRAANRFQRAQDFVLSSPLWAGPFCQRYSGNKKSLRATQSHLILCNLAFHRKEDLRFQPHLHCAEENELIRRWQKRGRYFGFFPELVVHHERRSNTTAFFKQSTRMGYGRAQIVAPKSKLGILLIAPAGLCLLMSFFWSSLAWLWHIPRIHKSKASHSHVYLAGLILQTGYIWGLMKGLLKSSKP
jgi:glycosyltransferase involved in cell wall biosynthesis